ncbi:hypothetical protein [Prochlorococcus sp. MIT 1341]|uniref:hypothetical protein n=1 Tax=Prochlorococcus sp. MIT 1341 TaxID=3096221 RepID=UPI002A761727|nr:hypothetical protein [Prochlorococcus sp. MIT 1341]
MESDLLIPLIWTVVFGILLTLGVRKFTKKQPTNKRWVRPKSTDEINKSQDE